MAKAKEIEGLDCHAHALTGARLVLSTRLEEMIALRNAALDWSDIEGVHDMRVASRRLRSALYDFRPYLSDRFRTNRLRDLARSLGAVRDEDVTIAALKKLAAEAPEEVMEGLNHIINMHAQRRERARAALTEALSLPRLLSLHGKYLGRFERTTQIPVGGPAQPAMSFRQAGAEIIRERLKELYELGETIYRPFEIERLHEMRIAAKRLRYAMELFAQCWGAVLSPFSTEVSQLQESLGDLHDCDVWVADLSKRLRRNEVAATEEAAAREAAIRVAAIWLLQHYTKARARHYRRALERWREWEKAGFRERLHETLSEEAIQNTQTHAEVANIS